MYTYKAKVDRVVDGDTIDCTVDLGFCIYVKERFRFAVINAPEMSTPEGKVTKDVLSNMILGKDVTLNVIGKDKYGRWLATVMLGEVDVNQWLLNNGYAKLYT